MGERRRRDFFVFETNMRGNSWKIAPQARLSDFFLAPAARNIDAGSFAVHGQESEVGRDIYYSW